MQSKLRTVIYDKEFFSTKYESAYHARLGCMTRRAGELKLTVRKVIRDKGDSTDGLIELEKLINEDAVDCVLCYSLAYLFKSTISVLLMSLSNMLLEKQIRVITVTGEMDKTTVREIAIFTKSLQSQLMKLKLARKQIVGRPRIEISVLDMHRRALARGLKQAAEDLGISYDTIKHRLMDAGFVDKGRKGKRLIVKGLRENEDKA